ncbi:hypothetical protein LTR10_022784 [Elasticomyces elasticus]|uniref:Oxidoreductase NAD-binding domain-containing protein 1 n=1 Tax=Exophiala sideris TaxID=1016849 RepID=A0ABR0JLX1_9EURO|nr:hypothetical protein LTR10_022784 [Elasticomyces elasticus]KAK5036588.1 hypothetical protein LTS07_002315 [Exophiala sideris]KAK5041581.1 hypothetical protein LTR13_002248 [Exophiala sideris]KAK5066971.1 hypothetical protein LTR69_002319 [Exophiala sideris]KAK5185030.1 hypothetical protein LTR44_002876 [Eurotiomycetes sp. CCFEE 6388]
MATVKDSIPHIIRTAEDPRQKGVWTARLSKIEQVNSKIRLLRLSLPKDGSPLRHLPGQYVDLYIPNIDVVGGFTITSPPQAAVQNQDDPHIELAIQSSPGNPPAAYLWRPVPEIIDSTVTFRIGGNFAYPPLTLSREQCESIERVVFIAGGVGINPIMSMISAMNELGTKSKLGGMVKTVRVLYSARRERNEQGEGEEILFEKRLKDIAGKWKDDEDVDYTYTLFETGGGQAQEEKTAGNMTTRSRRINHSDLFEAIGPEDTRGNTVVYVCGLPTMTDEFVELLRKTPRLDEKRVLCEKWW